MKRGNPSSPAGQVRFNGQWLSLSGSYGLPNTSGGPATSAKTPAAEAARSGNVSYYVTMRTSVACPVNLNRPERTN